MNGWTFSKTSRKQGKSYQTTYFLQVKELHAQMTGTRQKKLSQNYDELLPFTSDRATCI